MIFWRKGNTQLCATLLDAFGVHPVRYGAGYAAVLLVIILMLVALIASGMHLQNCNGHVSITAVTYCNHDHELFPECWGRDCTLFLIGGF